MRINRIGRRAARTRRGSLITRAPCLRATATVVASREPLSTTMMSASAQAAASKAARKPSNMGASAASSFSAGMMNEIGEGIARIQKASPGNVEPAATANRRWCEFRGACYKIKAVGNAQT